MTTSVYKYEIALRSLDVDSTTIVTMPRGAELLHAACQFDGVPDVVAVWARVNTSQPPVERRIGIFGTGHTIPDWMREAPHVGSIVTLEGRLVWHVFDGGER